MLTSTKPGLVQISIYADTKLASNQESMYQLKTCIYAGIKSQIAFLMGWVRPQFGRGVTGKRNLKKDRKIWAVTKNGGLQIFRRK